MENINCDYCKGAGGELVHLPVKTGGPYIFWQLCLICKGTGYTSLELERIRIKELRKNSKPMIGW
jgi:hypothetical protein